MCLGCSLERVEFLLATGMDVDRLAVAVPRAELRSHDTGERTVKTAPGRVLVTIGDGQLDGIAVSDGRLLDSEGVESQKLDSFIQVARRTRGNFVLLCEHGDEIFVSTDPLGTYPLFLYDGGPFLLSNNIFLIEDALGLLDVKLRPDRRLFGWETTFHSGCFDCTGFEDVRLAPLGAVAVASESGVRFITRPQADLLYSARSFDELIDSAAQEIIENVQALASGIFTHRVCDLTGGMDSRLVLAALLHAGLKDSFVFETKGKYPHPDENISRMLRQRFGLTHALDAHPPSTEEAGSLAGMRSFLARTFGSYTMLINIGADAPPTKDVLRLHGSMGETFRGFYTGVYGSSARPRMKPFYERIEKSGALLAKAIRQEQKEAISRWAEDSEQEGVRAEDLLDMAYIAHRNRYHFGITWRAGSIARTSFYPLYSPAAVQAAYKLRAEERTANRVGYELMMRFSPELVELPFAEKGWNPSIHTGEPPITRNSPKLFEEGPRDPTVRLFPHSKSRPETQWAASVSRSGRHPRLRSLDQMLREMRPLLDAPVDALAPVYIPGKVREFLDRAPHEFPTSQGIRVDRLLGALVWVNGMCPGPRPRPPSNPASRFEVRDDRRRP